MCNNCTHKIVCGKFRATGGVKSCEHHKEERRGRWEWWVEERPYFTSYDEDFGYICSECGTKAEEWGVDGDIPEEPPTRLHYCPNCGADMRGAEDA